MLTKEDWKVIKNSITLFCPILLKIDGYEISITLQIISKTKLAYFLYIDGCFKGEWLHEDCEIRRRFIRKEKHRTFEIYTPFWNSFTTLKNHLIKNNKEITWL